MFVIFGISLVSEDLLAVCLERLGRRASSDFLPPNEEERKTSQDALPTTHPFIATGSQVHKSSKTVDDGEPFVERQTKTHTTLYPPPLPPNSATTRPGKFPGRHPFQFPLRCRCYCRQDGNTTTTIRLLLTGGGGGGGGGNLAPRRRARSMGDCFKYRQPRRPRWGVVVCRGV